MERAPRKTGIPKERDADLRELLEDRRREILEQVRHSIRHVRAHHGRGSLDEVRDSMETSHALAQEDLDLALLQLKSETLEKIENALVRLDERTYGYCFECGEEIARQRLASLPFALRCTRCEEGREASARAEKAAARRNRVVPDVAA
jgi:RNA polymerase-binding transcription factor